VIGLKTQVELTCHRNKWAYTDPLHISEVGTGAREKEASLIDRSYSECNFNILLRVYIYFFFLLGYP
jgi:hypothetical protein